MSWIDEAIVVREKARIAKQELYQCLLIQLESDAAECSQKLPGVSHRSSRAGEAFELLLRVEERVRAIRVDLDGDTVVLTVDESRPVAIANIVFSPPIMEARFVGDNYRIVQPGVLSRRILEPIFF